MKSIWKYTIDTNIITKSEIIEFKIPVRSVIINVNEQENNICIWFEIEINNKKETRFFNVRSTGDEWKENLKGEEICIGSCSIFSEKEVCYVYHIYEIVYHVGYYARMSHSSLLK